MTPAPAYLRYLTSADLAVLAGSVGLDPDGAGLRERFAADADLLDRALSSTASFERLFGPEPADTTLIEISPTLLFAVVVHRAADDLADTMFVEERIGQRTSVPVFDTPRLLEFASDRERRRFLVELLVSYTKVVSGRQWVQRGGRWRRRRFSELEPAQMASLLEETTDEERLSIYRRLGDLALFLTGVFPDHVARRPVAPIELERLARTVREPLSPDVLGPRQSADLYEWLGPRWYRSAGLAEVADQFDQARRCLVFVTDRYLFPHRDRWFPWRN